MMGNSVHLTENELKQMVERLREDSADPDVVKQLDRFAAETETSGKTKPDLECEVDELRRQSPMSEGKCLICGSEGALVSGVCDSCFRSWSLSVVRSKGKS